MRTRSTFHRVSRPSLVWAILNIAGLAAGVSAGQQVVLDFNSIPNPPFPQPKTILPSPYHEDGFIIGQPSGDQSCQEPNFAAPRADASGNKYLLVDEGVERQYFVIAEANNGTFDLVSFDIAVLSDDDVDPVDVFGIRHGGTIVEYVDPETGKAGYIVEEGDTAFYTLTPAGFTNLVALVVVDRQYETPIYLDNVVLDNIQPGSGFPIGETTIDFEEIQTPEEFGVNSYGRLYYNDGYMIANAEDDEMTQFRFLGSEATGSTGSKAIIPFYFPSTSTENNYSGFSITRIDGQPVFIRSMDIAIVDPFDTDPITMELDGISPPDDIEIVHSEPNVGGIMPTLVRYDLNVEASPCWFFFGQIYTLQFDNFRVTTDLTPFCPADFNGDSVRDVADLFAYINAWLAKTSSADFNADSAVDVADLFAYINAWLAGC